MTINHHPDDDIILSYAAGSLAESWSLAVAAHLSFCPVCRDAVALAESVGGDCLANMDQENMAPGALAQVLRRLDDMPRETFAQKVAEPPGPGNSLPGVLQRYVGDDFDRLPWQRLGGGAYQYLIKTDDDEAQARLLKISAGRPVPSHGHGGRELTLVLSGEFQDEISVFGLGDLEDVAEETVHKPVAGAQEDCICLAVTDAPLTFQEFIPRILQPMLRI